MTQKFRVSRFKIRSFRRDASLITVFSWSFSQLDLKWTGETVIAIRSALFTDRSVPGLAIC